MDLDELEHGHILQVLQKTNWRIEGKRRLRFSLVSTPAPFVPGCGDTASFVNNRVLGRRNEITVQPCCFVTAPYAVLAME